MWCGNEEEGNPIAVQCCNYIERNLREEGNSHYYSRAMHYRGKRPPHVVVALK